MKAKFLLPIVLVPVAGLTFLSLPAGAECWDDVPSWINGNSERDGAARRNRDGRTSCLTRGTDIGQKTPGDGQGVACSSAG